MCVEKRDIDAAAVGDAVDVNDDDVITKQTTHKRAGVQVSFVFQF